MTAAGMLRSPAGDYRPDRRWNL